MSRIRSRSTTPGGRTTQPAAIAPFHSNSNTRKRQSPPTVVIGGKHALTALVCWAAAAATATTTTTGTGVWALAWPTTTTTRHSTASSTTSTLLQQAQQAPSYYPTTTEEPDTTTIAVERKKQPHNPSVCMILEQEEFTNDPSPEKLGDSTTTATTMRQFHPAATDRSTSALLALRQDHEKAASTNNNVNGSSSSPPQPPHKSLEELQLEYELHVGKALDTLRKDYPHILTTCPDFSIYDRNIQVIDPSGVTVSGLTTYQNSFRILHALVKCIYCPSRSTITFRMCYDKARRNIRIHWNTAVVPRELFGGSRQTLHVDGISVYELDQASGNITQHRIEKLLMNNMPVLPKQGVIAALRDEHRVSVPSFFHPAEYSSSSSSFPSNVLQFQIAGLGGKRPTSLFAMEASDDKESTTSSSSSSSSSSFPAFDAERFAAKNKSRKKFGLKPLTEEEFLAIEVQVKEMDAEQKERAAQAMAQAAAAAKQEKQGESFVDKLFGNVLKDTCESNWDCERPEVCCDFGFKKMCCSSGSLVANGIPQPALVPVPVDLGPHPPPGGRGREPRNY